ncbi:helix-turn-helix domain-containing protein [Paraburkholderia sp. 31.1]|uniref:helix-turn-helix domain-containing protein n=1 Tax=Paraburkholderia sp. 31.1 TaxID=2615205 RepID=UPI001D6261BD|nr:helix-turn-helix domain-containing protein [Paraburkholderia sp. 31.1]MBC8726602.1 helix-turn-helix domain-containing protein [Paraburkholderia sp. 31.1]
MTGKSTRRDFDQLSERRREAMVMLDEGMSQADVARELSVSRQTVSRWSRVKDAYTDSEPWRGRALGRPGGLSDGQKLVLVKRLVDSYVRELGPRGRSSSKPARWTLARVAGLIEVEFGVSYSLAHVRNILIGLVGEDHWPLSNLSFWARLIELAHPKWAGRVLYEDFYDGWVLDWRILGDPRRQTTCRVI